MVAASRRRPGSHAVVAREEVLDELGLEDVAVGVAPRRLRDARDGLGVVGSASRTRPAASPDFDLDVQRHRTPHRIGDRAVRDRPLGHLAQAVRVGAVSRHPKADARREGPAGTSRPARGCRGRPTRCRRRPRSRSRSMPSCAARIVGQRGDAGRNRRAEEPPRARRSTAPRRRPPGMSVTSSSPSGR